MPFWNRSRPSPPAAADWMDPAVWHEWEAPRNYIAGESHHRRALQALTGPVCEEGYCRAVVVTLEREPGNPYDANALRALVGGQQVGHLRRHLAAELAPALDRARVRSVRVPGVLRGGARRAEHVGCHIWLDRCLDPGVQLEIPSADPEWDVRWPPEPRYL